MSLLIYPLSRSAGRRWSWQKANREESVSLAEGWLNRGAGICQFFLATEIQWNVWSQRPVFWEPDFVELRLEQWKYINQCWPLQFICLSCLCWAVFCLVYEIAGREYGLINDYTSKIWGLKGMLVRLSLILAYYNPFLPSGLNGVLMFLLSSAVVWTREY